MPGTATHLAVADKIYYILGSGAITNLPLFFGGNIAPDAIHARKDFQRLDKKHTHLCDDIHRYGYGYPKLNELFHKRINNFIRDYYFTAGKEKDLYLGYIVHLLADELDVFLVCENLEIHLKESGINLSELEFSDKLANEVKSGDYRDYFSISVPDYKFNQNIIGILESEWSYEVKGYISADEINISKRWVINTILNGEPTQGARINNHERAVQFIDFAAKNIIKQLHDIL